MSIELVVVGDPFLDLSFSGLPHLPKPGEEVVARELHVGPGGAAIQAVGAARLGLSVGLVGVIGRDAAGRLLRDLLKREGVRHLGPDGASTPVTALLGGPEGVAMASALAQEQLSAADVRAAGAGAAMLSLGRAGLAEPEQRLFVVTGGLELPGAWVAFASERRRAHALMLNEREAAEVTGVADPLGAAAMLALHADTVVVTLAERGAIGISGDVQVRVPAVPVDAVDATGAGDLFAAAYVWADLRGADLESRLRWSVLAAGLSMAAPSPLAGAAHIEMLLDEGRRRGLSPP